MNPSDTTGVPFQYFFTPKIFIILKNRSIFKTEIIIKQTSMETSSFSENTLPNNNMTLAIIATVLGLCSPCCIGLILGIIAIVLSSQVNTKFESGDFGGALSSAKNSKTLSFIALGLLALNLIFLLGFGGLAAYQELIEAYNISQ